MNSVYLMVTITINLTHSILLDSGMNPLLYNYAELVKFEYFITGYFLE